MSNTAVSVIIPIYNVDAYLNKTVESVVGQTLQDIEIILVNDGSQDNSPLIADEWGEKDCRVKVVHKGNEGVTKARNTGLSIAAGKYILFLDGDDFLEMDALEKMYKKAVESDADWVVGDFVIENADGTSYLKEFPDFDRLDNVGFLKYCYANGDFYYTGRLIKRSFIVNAEVMVPHEITYGEDNIAVTQLGAQLSCVARAKGPTLHYVMRVDSVTNRISKKDLDSRSKACALCYDYISAIEFYPKVEKTVCSFFVNEFYSCVKRGYIGKDMYRVYKQCKGAAENISAQKRIACGVATVSPRLAMFTVSMIKSIRNLIR